MADFGGIMRFTYGGTQLIVRGKVTTSPASMKADAITNTNGSTSRSLTPKGFGAEITFEDSTAGKATALNWDSILKGGPYNISLIEDQTGIVHTWTSGNFVGDVKVDRMNGDVTGLEIHADAYQTKQS